MIFRNKKRILLLTLLLALLLLAIPYTVKFATDDDALVNQFSYYTVRLIEQYKTVGISDVDSLTGRSINFNLYHYLLSFFKTNPILIIKIVTVFLGLLSILFSYLLMQQLGVEADNMLFALIVLLISPIYLYTFTVFTSEAFALTMLLLASYLFVKNNYFSAVPLLLGLFTNFVMTMATLLLMITFSIAKNTSKRILISNFLSVIFAGVVGSFFLNFNPMIDTVSRTANISNLFLAFGSVKGYSLIMLILAIFGFSLTWKRTLNQTLIYSMVTVVFVASIFYSELIILTSIIFAALAGTAINISIRRKWKIRKLKGVTLLLIIYIMVFSAAVFLKNDIQQVSIDQVDSIKYLSVAKQDDIILSAERNGFIIEQIANRKAFLDANSFRFLDYDDKLNISDSIYYSRNLQNLELILKEQNITHILVDEQMKSGEIWGSSDEGILFLLENSDSFVKLFDNKKIQIYRYIN